MDNRFTTRSSKGQKFCTGGARSSEVCGWKVTETSKRFKYSGGESCVISGDSGGSSQTSLW
ncbi:hypothetical protein ACFV2Z_29610 [Streptomyces sp. NPDC059688]|uniref:hypothetical protein n=1 Tax=Streptomyces sp. NPDC059688 TaxID=3346906 RepID=UPI0036C0CCB9